MMSYIKNSSHPLDTDILSASNHIIEVGNNFDDVLEITVGETATTYSDQVGTTDPYDYYRFTLTQSSDFSLSLTGLLDQADVELLDSRGRVLIRSENWSTDDEHINVQLLTGTYYIRVEPTHSTANTDYDLTVAAIPIIEAGNNFGDALEITVGETATTYRDWVGTTDLKDYYRFTLDKTSDFNLSLTGLSKRVDVELIDNSGAVLVRADDHGSNEQNIDVQLLEGTYYLRVEPSHSGANTDYDLSVSATPVLNPDNSPNSPNTLYAEELSRKSDYGFTYHWH